MILYEEVASRDWYKQALVIESRIKVFFGISSANQLKLISEAKATKIVTAAANATLIQQQIVVSEVEDNVATQELEDAVALVKIEEEDEYNEVDLEAPAEQVLNFSQPS